MCDGHRKSLRAEGSEGSHELGHGYEGLVSNRAGDIARNQLSQSLCLSLSICISKASLCSVSLALKLPHESQLKLISPRMAVHDSVLGGWWGKGGHCQGIESAFPRASKISILTVCSVDLSRQSGFGLTAEIAIILKGKEDRMLTWE